jgi:hypothetical protein
MGSNRLKSRKDRFTRPAAYTLAAELGLLRWRDWGPLGIPRPEVRNILVEVAPGVRGSSFIDATTIAAKRVPQAVLCMQSALYFHGLREEPPEVWLALSEKGRKPRVTQPRIRTVRFSGRALTEGIEVFYPWGVPVRIYCLAKTVADLFKYRRKLGYLTAVLALHDVLRSGRCTPAELRHYAAICRVSRTLEPWLQALCERGAPMEPRALFELAARRRSAGDRIPRRPLINSPSVRRSSAGWT